MNLFRRAFSNLFRNYKRTLTMLMLFIALGSLGTGIFIVSQAAQQTEINLRRRVPPVALLRSENNTIWYGDKYQPEDFGITIDKRYAKFNNDLVELLQDSPFVKVAQVLERNTLARYNLDAYLPLMDSSHIGEANRRILFQSIGTAQSQHPLFQAGIYELSEGRFFSDEELLGGKIHHTTPVMIPRPLAELNHLSIGSVFSKSHYLAHEAYQPFGLSERDKELLRSLSFELEVIGIFEIEYEVSNNEQSLEYMLNSFAVNQMIVPDWYNPEFRIFSAEVIGNIENLQEQYFLTAHENLTPLIVLNDALDLEVFIDYLQPLLPDSFEIQHLFSYYEIPIHMVSQLNELLVSGIMGLIGGSIVILSLLLMFYFKERKQEIGILLALGESKVKVMIQVALESLLVFFLSTPFSLTAGFLLSRMISHEMIFQEILLERSTADTIRLLDALWPIVGQSGIPLSAITDDDLMSMFNISLSGQMISWYYLIGVLTILVSVIFSISYLLRLKPKEILL